MIGISDQSGRLAKACTFLLLLLLLNHSMWPFIYEAAVGARACVATVVALSHV